MLYNLKNIESLISVRDKEYGGFNVNAKLTNDFIKANYETIQQAFIKDENTYAMTYFYMFMIGAKLARLHNNPTHEDSINDLIGYTLIYKKSCDYRFAFNLPDTLLNCEIFVNEIERALNAESDN